MSVLRESLDAAFRTAGLRPTAQRYAVLEFLARRPRHATAEEIFHAVNRADPRASRATVYNSLRALAGQLQRLPLPEAAKGPSGIEGAAPRGARPR